jgi:glycine dehydrogenase
MKNNLRRFIPNKLSDFNINDANTFIRSVYPKNNYRRTINIPQLSFAECRDNIANRRNRSPESYYGLGFYHSKVPEVLKNNFIMNPNFYSAYIPYQSEISQGRLELQFNYQKTVTDLFNMDISNCSLLDEASSCAEAIVSIVSSIKATDRKNIRLLIDSDIYTQNLAVIKTRCHLLGITPELVTLRDTLLNRDDLKKKNTIPILFIQNPNASGTVCDLETYSRGFKDTYPNARVIVSTDPLMNAIYEPPGSFDADIVVGSMQRFGLPMWSGGPHAGVFACKEEYLRNIPGRLVGKSVDSMGDECYRLALQTREQHIKKDKALSNICTSQALLANYSALYSMYLGPEGIKNNATYVKYQTDELKQILKENEHGTYRVNTTDPTFDTIELRMNSYQDLIDLRKRAEENGVFIRTQMNPMPKVYLSLDETKDTKKLNHLLRSVFNANANVYIIDKDLSYLDTRETPLFTDAIYSKYNTEHGITRYLTSLAKKDMSLTHSMIPLGSCTMKLNSADTFISLFDDNWANVHPFSNTEEGYSYLINKMEHYLSEITGLPHVSFQSNSGATGEYSALNCIRKYHLVNDEPQRNICLIPDSAHGTNFSSAKIAGFNVKKIKSLKNGELDIEHLKEIIEDNKDHIGCAMITFPSTFGFFEHKFTDIVSLVKEAGGKIYCDGANMNALMGVVNLKDIGIDACHLNLHKTFGIPHGGGGPGMGPICVTEELNPFLPCHPIIHLNKNMSYGSVAAAPHSSAILLTIVYYYISLHGGKGLEESSLMALAAANYIKDALKDHYDIPFTNEEGMVSHELIINTKPLGIAEKDIAKRLMDYGYHAPTMSWPISNSLMIEPTETESKEELDRFISAMISIKQEINETPELLKNAPHSKKLLYLKEWPYTYSKDRAFFPIDYLKENKFDIPIERVDDFHGDRNLILK